MIRTPGCLPSIRRRRKPVPGIIFLTLLAILSSMTARMARMSESWALPYCKSIQIKADGSIYPVDTPISTFDNITYTFTDDIRGRIEVKRDNIIIDGAGHSITGCSYTDIPYPPAVEIYGRTNITVTNMNITIWPLIGIAVGHSSNITISGVNVANCAGISLYDSSNNVLRNNSMTNNSCNFWIESETVEGFHNDIDVSNTVDGRPICYWVNQHDKQVPSDAGFIALVNCYRILVQDQNISKNSPGMLLVNTTDSRIIRNTFTRNSFDDICILWSSNNTLCENTLGQTILYSSLNNTISDHKKINYLGLHKSSNNKISGNTIGYVRMHSSSNNTMFNNTCTGKTQLSESPSNIFRSNNAYSFEVDGYQLEHFIQDIDESNAVNEEPIYYWVNKKNGTPPTPAGYVALVNCTNITVRELNLKGRAQAILFAYTKNSTITGNNLTDNYCGIQLVHSSNNVICQNYIICEEKDKAGGSFKGIHLKSSSNNNHIHQNTITDYFNGILIDASFDNTISGNYMTNNRDGIVLRVSSANNISDNILTKNGNGILLSKSLNTRIFKNNVTANEYGVHLTFNSSSNEIWGNQMTKNEKAIYLEKSSNNSMYSNDITLNILGFVFWDSSNHNSVYRNNITGNTKGIFLNKRCSYPWYVFGLSVNNTIYLNNFANNTAQATAFVSVVNYWDNGFVGNYWSDYEGTDVDEDGIGDTPYIIVEGNQDNYPLMRESKIGPRGDLNNDGRIDGGDIILAAKALGSYPEHARWNPICDINGDNVVDCSDLVMLAKDFGKS